MSYDLAVWEGPRPDRDDDAVTTFEQLMDHMENDLTDEPPSAAIAGFVEELLERWPDLSEPGSEQSPWAAGPLMEEASGPLIYFAMTFSGAERAMPEIIRIARERRLVCFDPQTECLL